MSLPPLLLAMCSHLLARLHWHSWFRELILIKTKAPFPSSQNASFVELSSSLYFLSALHEPHSVPVCLKHGGTGGAAVPLPRVSSSCWGSGKSVMEAGHVSGFLKTRIKHPDRLLHIRGALRHQDTRYLGFDPSTPSSLSAIRSQAGSGGKGPQDIGP